MKWTLNTESSCASVVSLRTGDFIDQGVVQAFFQALSPVELDVYACAMAVQQAADQQADPRPSSNSLNGCVIKQLWRSVNSVGLTPEIAWVAVELGATLGGVA